MAGEANDQGIEETVAEIHKEERLRKVFESAAYDRDERLQKICGAPLMTVVAAVLKSYEMRSTRAGGMLTPLSWLKPQARADIIREIRNDLVRELLR